MQELYADAAWAAADARLVGLGGLAPLCDCGVVAPCYRTTITATRFGSHPSSATRRRQGCRLIEYDDAPVLYTDNPNVERVS